MQPTINNAPDARRRAPWRGHGRHGTVGVKRCNPPAALPSPRPTLKETGAVCELTTTASYHSVEAILGWTGATTGMLTLDAASLIKRQH